MDASGKDYHLLQGGLLGVCGLGYRELVAAVTRNGPAKEFPGADLGFYWVLLDPFKIVHEISIRVWPAVSEVNHIVSLLKVVLKLQGIELSVALFALD